MNRRWISGLALLVTACSSGSDSGDNAADPVALVKVAPVTEGASAQQQTIYGAAESGPGGKMSLVAPIEAKVFEIVAPVGTPVRQGQVVVRLTASPTTRVDAAKAVIDAAAANAAFARAQRMRADGLMSDADVETARASAASANALRASFASRAGDLTLRAPSVGVVDTVAVATGDLLQPGAAVATVTRVSDVRVRFGVDPDTARSIHPGVQLIIAGGAGRAPVSATVEAVNGAVDAQTKLTAVFARIPAGSGILPGQSLTATIDIGKTSAAMSVPYSALLDDAGQAYVYIVSGGAAHRRDVVSQPASGDHATIVKGLKPGERVVVEGGTALEDGMKVRTQ